MTKEQFFYAYKELAHEHDSHILLESGRAVRYVWRELIRL